MTSVSSYYADYFKILILDFSKKTINMKAFSDRSTYLFSDDPLSHLLPSSVLLGGYFYLIPKL